MSFEAEQAVLCGIMLDAECIEVALAEGLAANDFLHQSHRIIFKAMLELDAKDIGIDLISIAYHLEEKNLIDDVGGREYLSDLTYQLSNTENTAAYSRLIIESSRKHKLRILAASIEAMVAEGNTSEEIEVEVNSLLTKLETEQQQKTSFTLIEAIKDFVADIQSRANGKFTSYESGLTDLDSAIKIENGRLYVIAGRPAMGKSTLAQVIAETTAKAGISTLFFSLEMPHKELAQRIVASQASIDRALFKNPTGAGSPEAWKIAGASMMQMQKWPLEIENKGGLTLSDVKIKANQFFRKSESYKKDGKGMIVIDYLGLMKISGTNRVHGLGEITKGLKQLAMRLQVPIILLHQLNRGIEQRSINDRRPYMSDLRDSGEIEEDADGIIFVYRDEVYNEDSDLKGIAELIIRKNRDGELGAVKVQSQLKYSRFSNLSSSMNYGNY